MKKALRLIFAYFLIIMGVLGSFVPGFPGIAVLLAGIYLVNPKKFNRWLNKVILKLSPNNQKRVNKILKKYNRDKHK